MTKKKNSIAEAPMAQIWNGPNTTNHNKTTNQ